MNTMTATYSPDDNKLRLYTVTRLDRETYDKVKAAGFKWAPKQELFVAPMWTPAREDLLIELCGEVDDEDTSLVDRAEQRADRFEDYSERRVADSERAHAAVSAIADNIPFGQPILVGHHSEKRARKDAERIENGMRKAVKLWDTAKYWTSRAAGAIQHAKYKERPDVRARRIKGLEADKRKQERTKAEAEKLLKGWSHEPMTTGLALQIANHDHGYHCFTLAKYPRDHHTYEGEKGLWSALDDGIIDGEQAAKLAIPPKYRTIAHCERWIQHIDNRLAYEKAMLEEAGASDLLKPAPRPEQLPLCNYRAPEGFIMVPNMYNRGELEKYRQVDMTKAEYAKIYTDYKGCVTVENSHRVRMTCLRSPQYERVVVFITDSKAHAKPEPLEKKEFIPNIRPIVYREPTQKSPEDLKFDALKESLKSGVQTVTAPQLFPTPPEIAAQMVELAEIEDGNSILEPSAGTGNIIMAIRQSMADGTSGRASITAVEINAGLSDRLINVDCLSRDSVHCTDFLTWSGGTFDRIIMNPPFENAVDIKHIRHAQTLLNPGGKLVALCANGPRQQEAFKVVAEHWEVLPAGSFQAQGTGVNVALVVLRA